MFDIVNYADDSTPYWTDKIFFQWINNNCLKVNTGWRHLLLSGNSRATATIDNSYIELEDYQVLLGITIDSNLTSENHIKIVFAKKKAKS